MTAAELASFRALLQAQAAAQPSPDRGLFARMRSRLTVVEGAAAPRAGLVQAGPWPRLELVAAVPADERPADPPPSRPPAFGRRDGPPSPPRPPNGEPAVSQLRGPALADFFATPDELDDPRAEPPPPASTPKADRPTPGVIAGWSRARPPSAQRRLLGRLEAVLQAEREGLDARRAADAP